MGVHPQTARKQRGQYTLSIVLLFSITAVLSALVAALYRDARRVVLALWVCGMCFGAIFLSFGAEVLAVVQWIVTTLVGISLLFFSSMFGELGSKEPKEVRSRKDNFDLLQAAMVGIAFVAILGVSLLRFQPDAEWASHLVAGTTSGPSAGQDLQALGQLLTERHFISLEVLGVTLLLVLIGGGVLARPEGIREGFKK
jgi:NADH:ubiquinone oxidoreductase subunit 6 (subunit J)